MASQMDIYPSVVDLIGYNKPFRSWGRSLISDLPNETPRVVNSPGTVYQFMEGGYIYLFDGSQFTGLFAASDKGLQKNLMPNGLTADMQKGMLDCKALIQDYNARIVNKKLSAPVL
jgi:hypothetical protein